jgi:hypothetical protein
MDYVSKLLGYDARVKWTNLSDTGSYLNSDRLILKGLSEIYSCHGDAWPSVFDWYSYLQRPRFVGPNYDLWENSEKMILCLENQNFDYKNMANIIAVTYEGPLPMEEIKHLPVHFLKHSLQENDKQRWFLSGFDVGDDGLSSALLGLSHDVKQEYKAKRDAFAALLNNKHLFNSKSDAFKFCQFENSRVPEHAPFLIYGIWLLDQGWCN